MLYLSKITFAPPVIDIYVLHQRIWKAFANGNPQKKRDFLFRVEQESAQRQVVLVQSQTLPHWENVTGLQHFEIKSYHLQFRANQYFFFSLRANAVVSKTQPDQKRSLKVPLRPQDYLDQPIFDESGRQIGMEPGWLSRQGELYGFEVLRVERLGKQGVTGKASSGSQHDLRLTGQNLQGYLRLTDPDKFLQVYLQGLGRGKAFGFGLLTLRKLRPYEINALNIPSA